MGGGPPRFPPDSACPAVLTLLVHPRSPAVAYGTLTRCGGPFQQPSADRQTPSDGPAEPSHQVVQPRTGIGGSLCHPPGLGSARFARRYSGPPVFSSGYSDVSIPPVPPGSSPVSRYDPGRVAPFGDLWLTRSQHVPRAFRRVGASFVGRWRLGIPHVLIFVMCVRTAPGQAGRSFVVRAARPPPGCSRRDARAPRGAAPDLVNVPAPPRGGRTISAARPVEPRGVEPRTSAVQRRRSPS